VGVPALLTAALAFSALAVLYVASCLRVIKQYERGVVMRLGRVLPRPLEPGLRVVFWPVERLERVSLRTCVHDVPPQDLITKDNVSVSVSAVVYYRVVDPLKAVLEVENYRYATSELSQTTLRSVLGQGELDELLGERERFNRHLREVIDQQSGPWGVNVLMVEVKHIDLPDALKRTMAQQAESERERRAKVIHAEGEFQAAGRLRDAAVVLEGHPMAMQMRFLQTLADIGTEQKNSTIVLPFPIELFAAFQTSALRERSEGSGTFASPTQTVSASAPRSR